MSIEIDTPKGNFGGYDRNAEMLAPPDDELTKVGPGTPCGEYLRRYWMPIAMTQQITDLPLRVRILGEDLVLFRDGSDHYGLLHLNCSHRNASLEYGIIEEKGIRCCYHGWLYDVDGTIMEAGAEPLDSKITENVRHGAYPVIEFKGLIFTYMGPTAEMPAFPVLDHFDLGPDDDMVPFLIPSPCNWLQVYENSFDPFHTAFLHSRVSGVQFTNEFAVLPVIDIFERDYGYAYTNSRRVDDKIWLRFHDHLPPNFSQNGSMFPDANETLYFARAGLTRWVVPIDDTNTITIAWRHFIEGMDKRAIGNKEDCGYNKVDFYGQTADRPYEQMQRMPGDYEAWTSQGPVSVHKREHLGTTDRGLAMARNHHRRAIRNLAKGETLPQPTVLGDPIPLWGGDTILRIPKSNTDERQQISDVAHRVVDIYRAGDKYVGEERIAFMHKALKEFEANGPHT